MNPKLIFLIQATLLCLAFSSRIVPDINNPLFLTDNQARLLNQTLSLTFTFNSESNRLKYSHYFGIDLSSIEIELFKGGGFKCNLKDETTNEFFYVEAALPVGVESSKIGYCKFTDTERTLSTNRKYTLSLYFASMNDIEDITFIPSVSLFTLIDLSEDSMEIDSSLTFGSIATYSNYASSTPALSIITASSSVKVSSGSSTSGSLIYKGDEFTVNLAVETFQKIAKEAIILIEFDDNYFTGPTQAVSTSFDTSSELHSNIKGSLSLTKMTDYSYKLENISQDLVKGRKANLNLKGWTAKEATVTNSKVILKVLHPNTSSVISYSAASILTVNPVKVTSTIKVLNNPSIFSSAAWPLEFTLSFNVDLDNFFVMLENTYSTKQRINFISSTCDFSDSGVSAINGASIDKEPFSQIGKCFPMHFTPKNSDTASNATFFRVPRLDKNNQIKVRVWVFAEKCGSSFNITNVTDTSVKAAFKIKLFNKIDASADYDNRFDTTVPSFRPAAQTRLHYEKKEYETKSAAYDTPVIMLTESPIPDENSFDCFNSVRGMSAADAEQHTVIEKTESTSLIYRFIREITDFEIRDFSRTISSGNYVFQYKDSTNSAILTPSLSIQSSSRAYLFENNMEGKFPSFIGKMTVDNAKPFEQSIPSDKNMLVATEINGPLEIHFAKRWFKTGNYKESEADITYDNFCYLSWQLKNDADRDKIDFSYPIQYDTTVTGDQLAKFRALNVDVTTAANGSNIITQIYNAASGIKSTLDINSSILADGTNAYYSIVGYDNIHGAGPTYYRYRFNLLDTTNPAATTVHFGLFTTCLKWNDVQVSRYLFDNLEVTFVLKDRQRSTPARILRMNSFITLGGVFSNPSSTKKADDEISSGLKVGTYSANRQSICVTSISNSLLEQSAFSDGTNRVLLLSFFNIFLFDTDYESSYADYPVIGLKREVRSFGFNTSLPVTAANYRVDSDLYFQTGTIFNTASSTGRQIELMLFASQVWITPISSSDSFTLPDSSNVVIPHYCQEDPSAVDDGNIGATSKITAGLSISWLKADSFTEINSMSEVIKGDTLQQIKLVNIANPTYYYINWMFSDVRQSSQYMVTDNNSVNPNTTPNITNPEGMIFLFSNDVYFKDLNAFDVDLGENLTTSYFAYMSQKAFYFLGQRYTRSLLCNFTYKTGETKNFGVSKFKFGGIYRPPLDEMVEDGLYSYSNQLATATISAAGNYLMHNLYLSGTGSTVKPAEAVFSLETSSFTWDSRYDEKKVEIYKNDNYSNSVEAVILAPAEIPSGTLLKIKLLDANHLKNISKCAAKSDLSSTASNCTQTVDAEGKYFFECPVREERLRQITVCCYNLGAKDSLMVEEVSLLTQPDPRNIPSNRILFSSSLFQKYTKAVNEKPDANPAKLLGMEYIGSNSENSLSELKIMVDTGRKLQVDYVFEIDGDFRELVLGGKPVECSASFNQNQNRIGDWEGGDSQLKNCTISDFDTANGKIKVETKDFIYNCSTDFKTTLNIYLSPVKVTKFDTTKELTLKTYMKFFQQSLLTFSRPRFPEVKTVTPSEFADYSEQAYFAQVIDVFPPFTTSTKKITISINLGESKDSKAITQKINVLILDLTRENFEEIQDKDYFCRDPNNKRVIHCYSKENKLHIHFISTYYQEITKFPIEIVDIPFPAESINFDVEVAQFTSDSTVVSLGRGRGRVHLNLPPVNEEYAGKLFFLNDHSKLVRPNPRFLTSFQLAFKIDSFLPFHTDNHNLGRKPKLILELPPSYSVPNNSDKKVSLLLEKVLVKTSTIGKEVEELEAPQMVKFTDTIVPFGNFIVLELNDSTATTDFVPETNLSHYKIDLQNIMAPPEEADNSGIINIYLTNDNYSKIYRTYSNTVNLAENSFGTGIIYAYRGFAFKFAEIDWVLDFYENDKKVDHLNVVSGFYSEYSLNLRYRGQSTTASGSAEVQIVRESYSPFFLRAAGDGLDERVMVSSSINRVNFEIGCTCSTTPGRYLAKFILTNKKGSEGEFAMETRIPVTVAYKPEKLECGFTSLQIPLSYMVEFNCSITRKVVEVFFPEFQNQNQNDNTVLSFVKFDEEQKLFSFRFTASFYNEIGIRTYKGIPNSKCAYFPHTFEFNLAIIAVEGVKSSDLDNVFYSSNGKFDSSLSHNDIKIAYLPERPYSYMKCAIYCGKEPGDAVVQDQIDNNKSTDLRLFYRYVEVAQESSYVFSGLNRNVEYFLKCFVEDSVNTKDAILQKNTFSKIIIDMNEGSKAGDIAPIRANPTLDTKCVEFSLDKVKTDKFQQAVVDKCQALITLGSLNAAGCLICTDIYKNVLSEGSTLNSNLCSLSEEKVIPVKNDTLDTKFSLCVVQDPRCPSTITPDEFTTKFNSVFNFFETNKKQLKDVLKINETYTYSIQTVTDGAIPTITKDNFTLNSLEVNFNGGYTFEVTLDKELDCYYRMRKFYQPVPAASVLKECAATDGYCGRFFAFKDQKVKVNSVNSTKEFYREQTYIVDVACENKVVYSKHAMSNVFQIGEYKIQALNKTCPMPYLDLNPQRDTECTCRNKIGHSIPQGSEGEYCYDSASSWLQLLGWTIALLWLA